MLENERMVEKSVLDCVSLLVYWAKNIPHTVEKSMSWTVLVSDLVCAVSLVYWSKNIPLHLVTLDIFSLKVVRMDFKNLGF